MRPKMIIVAGPPGGGKSTAFPVSTFGVAYFNADDRAADLNAGSYAALPRAIRERVNCEFEEFVIERIKRRESFAIETTLRSDVTFEQLRLAKSAGFTAEMRYLALQNFGMHLERVKARADTGGHSASEATLRRIHDASIRNLRRAVEEIDNLWVYDNSAVGGPPELVLQAKNGRVALRKNPPPAWLALV
ncbi:MAG: hypothetical protein FJW20_02705 [Acidimicrobiia bacterium]|nr:hypothetical protein [Acidimicrobiia bacterium]